jgi:hypothetical protein
VELYEEPRHCTAERLQSATKGRDAAGERPVSGTMMSCGSDWSWAAAG